MSFFGAIKSAFSSKRRKIIHIEAKGAKQAGSEEFNNLFINMHNGYITYNEDVINIYDANFNELRKAPFIKKLDDGWLFYEDPRGLSVVISRLGEKGVLSLFDFHTKEVEYKIAFRMTE